MVDYSQEMGNSIKSFTMEQILSFKKNPPLCIIPEKGVPITERICRKNEHSLRQAWQCNSPKIGATL